jgi:plastocyanin
MTRTSSFLFAGLVLAVTATGANAQESVSVQLAIKGHRFQPAEVRVPAGKPITLLVKNLDPTPEEFESKTLRVEKVITGNGEATIRLSPLEPGRYKFFGEFNEATAQGVLVAE